MTTPAPRPLLFVLVAAGLQLAGCRTTPAEPHAIHREVAARYLPGLARSGELDAVTHLTIVDGTEHRRGLDAEKIAALLRLPNLRELDLGALPGLWRDGEQVTVTANAQRLLAELLRAELRPAGRPRLMARGEDGTPLPELADLARPFSVELDLSGLFVPGSEPPQRFGSSFDPAVQRRVAAQTLVRATGHLAACCELVR